MIERSNRSDAPRGAKAQARRRVKLARRAHRQNRRRSTVGVRHGR